MSNKNLSKQKNSINSNDNNSRDNNGQIGEYSDVNSYSPSTYDKNNVSDHIGHLEEELSKSKRRESALRDKLSTVKAQLEQWRIEKQTELEAQIGALRLKLDKELEEKWERSQDKSIFTSVFSNIIETIAPHPTITRRKSQILGNEIDSMIDQELNGKDDSHSDDKELGSDSKNSPQV